MSTTRESPFPFRFRLVFAWYDLWVGAYFDRDNRRLYIFPVPCLGLRIDFRPEFVTLTITPYPQAKIRSIKEIRTATGLGLREAKLATEGVGLTVASATGYALAAALKDYAEVGVGRGTG